MAKQNEAAPAPPAPETQPAVDPRIAEMEAQLAAMRAEKEQAVLAKAEAAWALSNARDQIRYLEEQGKGDPSPNTKRRFRAKFRLGLVIDGQNVDIKAGDEFYADRFEMNGFDESHADMID